MKWFNRIIFIFCLFLTSCEYINDVFFYSPIENIIFTNKQNLPKNVLIDDEYFEKTGRLFLILSDYTSSYSKLVEYCVHTQEIKKILFESKSNQSLIFEFDINDGGIVFSFVKKEPHYSHSVYYYDIKKQSLNIVSDLLNNSKKLYPLNVKITNNYITWNEHDFLNEKSLVICYNIKNKSKKVIDSEEFDNSQNRVTMFFNDSDKNILIYDKMINKKSKLFLYDLEKNEKIGSFYALSDIKLHFNGSLNVEKKYAVLYGKTSDVDLLYRIDLNSKKNKKLVGFGKRSVLYGDRINTTGDEIIYTVQTNVSGKIIDHYYS